MSCREGGSGTREEARLEGQLKCGKGKLMPGGAVLENAGAGRPEDLVLVKPGFVLWPAHP